MSPEKRRTIALYVCTYRRNEELRRLLASVAAAAERAASRADVGVVVVDDNPEPRARPVADAFEERFPLGVTYVHSGQQNISRARNLGLATAAPLAEWVAMTDDDVVVPEDWFVQLVDAQERTGADAVTGPMLSRFPDGSPRWLVEQPFATIGVLPGGEDAATDTCATNNSMVRSEWLARHPDIRFEDSLGELGGEDMVFYRRAVGAGLRARYSPRTVVYQHEPPERSTFAYQLRRALWMGNSDFVANHRVGTASRWRLLLRGGRRVARGVMRPLARAARRQPPQLRFAVAATAEGVGMVLGALGVEIRHR